MKSRIFGGLCIAAFTLTGVAYLYGSPTHNPAENTEGITNHSGDTGQDQALEGEVSYDLQEQEVGQESDKADLMIVVTSNNCFYCEKMKKEVIPPLVKEGFQIRVIHKNFWTGPSTTGYPTLFFAKKGVIKTWHKGYYSVEQVKTYLGKP